MRRSTVLSLPFQLVFPDPNVADGATVSLTTISTTNQIAIDNDCFFLMLLSFVFLSVILSVGLRPIL
jgi:hypothetical protein